ncbi:helix-turn-helix domain-containing protein [Streptomyces sp. NPDC060366]|uniref:helix-turn-helix domain-containing protein n=1 Tax=Streptomyces sp. NPDC060366 TaxID=3347105 RepID=UPI003664F719
MGRPEKEIPHPESALGALAVYLRRARARAGLTYGQMEVRCEISIATLARAAGGERLPTKSVAVTYDQVCRGGGDVHELWEKAHRAERGHRTSVVAAPRLDLVSNRADLGNALVKVHSQLGAPSLRVMEKRAEEKVKLHGTLSRSTAHRILTRSALPKSPQQLQAFLNACQVPERDHTMWHSAWRRAQRQHEDERPRRTKPELPRRPIRPEVAVTMLHDAGFTAEEKFRGLTRPWTVRCQTCHTLCRIRLSDAWQTGVGCPGCQRSGRRVPLSSPAVRETPAKVCPVCDDPSTAHPRDGLRECSGCGKEPAERMDQNQAALTFSTAGSPFRIPARGKPGAGRSGLRGRL